MPEDLAELHDAPPADSSPAVYGRVLLKISGEGFSSSGGYGIEAEPLAAVARQCVEVVEMGVELAVVVGGGNFIRGATFSEDGAIPRSTADYMGMLATVLNALALQETIESFGVPARVQSAIPINPVCEPFIRRRAIRHLEKGRVVIFGAGTGNPFVTTDTAAALRAVEIGADVLMKATKVDGIYNKDPKKHDDARRFEEVSFKQVLDEDLKVMDTAAFAMCRDQRMPLVVFNLMKPGNIARVLRGETVGTKINP